MATLVWFTGCEAGPPTPNDNTGLGREFTALGKAGAVSPSIVTSPVRTGTYALKLPGDGSARGSVGTYPSNATTFLRAYFRIAANPTNAIIILTAGSPTSMSTSRFQLWLNTNGTLGWDFNSPAASAGPLSSGANALNLGAWNLIEIKYLRDAAAGGMEIFLNGVLQVSQFDRATTTNTSLTTMTLFFVNDAKVPGTGQSGQDMFWDDMAFGFGGYIGAGQSIAVQGKAGTPTYDAFTKNGGATAAENWSETPWSGTKNCTSSTVAQRQTMLVNDAALTAAIAAASVINGALVLAVTKIVTSGNCRITRRIGGVDTDSATKLLSTVDTMTPQGLDHTMDAFVETLANLASAEIGVVANSTNLLTVEDVWLLVDFTPPPPSPLLRDEGLPVEWLAKLARDDAFPAEWRGATVVLRDEAIPVEWLAKLARDEKVPVEWLGTPNPFVVRDEKIPVEWTGLPTGQLLLIWRVLNRLNTALALQWLVISGALNQNLQLQWQLKESLIPLTLRWNVLPPIVALGSQDVQRPTSIEQKTP